LAQILWQYDAYPVHELKFVSMSLNQFPFHQQGLEWYGVDLHA
jgi:hypothetical protein